MPFLSGPKSLHWTFHARDKMRFYRLSEQRVRSVINSPKRIEEGIAPKTVAMMQPSSVRWTSAYPEVSADKTGGKLASASGKREETWTQEIWVMIQDEKSGRKIISAWRYPGMSKPRSEMTQWFLKKEYKEFSSVGK